MLSSIFIDVEKCAERYFTQSIITKFNLDKNVAFCIGKTQTNKVKCMLGCLASDYCESVIYDTSNQTCYLYNFAPYYNDATDAELIIYNRNSNRKLFLHLTPLLTIASKYSVNKAIKKTKEKNAQN